MAYAIQRSKITDEQVEIIKKLLTIYPHVPNNKYQRNKKPEPIVFYNMENGIVHLYSQGTKSNLLESKVKPLGMDRPIWAD